MISISGNEWTEIKYNNLKVQKVSQDYSLSKVISKIILNNNFTKEEIYSIDNLINFKNPFLSDQEFNKSKEIIIKHIKNKKKILVIGDYDVDGSVSTAMFLNLFKHINHPFDFYIPDRNKDGYGISIDLFKKLKNRLTDLIIILDSGSKSKREIDYLNSLNIQTIIIDHHEIIKPYPKASVFINPKKNYEDEFLSNLCASTLTYFLIELIHKGLKLDFQREKYNLLAALATICDVMPLNNLNRYIIKKAIHDYNHKLFYFFDLILKKNKRNNELKLDDFAYLIGPILNSGGRLNKSNLAVELMISDDKSKIEKVYNQLFQLNQKRKEIEKNIFLNLDFEKLYKNKSKILIIKDIKIPEGLIGIIAARCVEKFNKPTIVVTQSGNKFKGSARSLSNINIGSIINNAVSLNILESGGGHKMAGGFNLKKENFRYFENYLNSLKILPVEIKKKYISKISSTALNVDFINNIKKLEPFGNNEKPIFLIESLKIFKPKIINKLHISCLLKDKKNKFYESIAFNVLNSKIGEYLMNYKKEINVLAELNISYKKDHAININIIDIII